MISENAAAANAAEREIPALQEQVSRERFTLDRPVDELFDHLKNLFPYVAADDARSYHCEQFAELARALAAWAAGETEESERLDQDFRSGWVLQGFPDREAPDLTLGERLAAHALAGCITKMSAYADVFAHVGCAGYARICAAAIRAAKEEPGYPDCLWRLECSRLQ